MKQTISLLICLVSAVTCFTIPPAFGACGGSSCNDQDHPDKQMTESEPSSPDQSGQPKYKATPRGASISDFVTPGRSAEKGCSGNDCREPGKPQPEMRVPEKKCSSDQGC